MSKTYTVDGPSLFGVCKDQNEIKKVFKKSFQGSDWTNAIPYKQDDLFLARDVKSNKILGFCMVHDKSPYEFKKSGPGFYMYNLCVDPDHQKQGIATALVKLVQKTYGTVHIHHVNYTAEWSHKWFIKRGFVPLDTWRVQYTEYTYPASAVTDATCVDAVKDLLNLDTSTLMQKVSSLYDLREHVFYLN